jgi:hypothetical protein
MAKLDKSLYTKDEWQKIRNKRRQEKLIKRAQKSQPEPPPPKLNSNIAFVLGNGTSRKPFSLSEIQKNGTMYACNAVYREFAPDHLIAVDTKMILEIAKSEYQLKNSVWTNPNKVYSKIPNLNIFDPSLGWSSGPTALHLASKHGYTDIYILGFDYVGLDSKINNVYAGTLNYKRKQDRATFHGNWLRQTQIVIEKNPQTRYIRVAEPDGFEPPELERLSNVVTITTLDFANRFRLLPAS